MRPKKGEGGTGRGAGKREGQRVKEDNRLIVARFFPFPLLPFPLPPFSLLPLCPFLPGYLISGALFQVSERERISLQCLEE